MENPAELVRVGIQKYGWRIERAFVRRPTLQPPSDTPLQVAALSRARGRESRVTGPFAADIPELWVDPDYFGVLSGENRVFLPNGPEGREKVGGCACSGTWAHPRWSGFLKSGM